MLSPEDTHIAGTPEFADPRLAALVRDQGALAAWREALTGEPAVALSGVEGAWAVGLRQGARTVLAVDRFAVRTLCWRHQGERLLFAERADELADESTPIDPQAIYEYLFFHAIPSPRTIFRGIHRLPPGHFLVFEHGQVQVAPYWTARFDESDKRPFDAQRDEFKALMKRAVTRQLDGGVPACFLSGGTDSSTVAGMICSAGAQPAHTYSIGFEAQGYDEMAYARTAARHFKTVHHEYYVTPADLVQNIALVAGHYDQPFGNSSALPAYCCALRAREDGVTKLLAGDGGDELFGGNTRYAKQKVFGWYDAVPVPVRRGLLEPVLGNDAVAALPVLRKAASYVEQARVPMPHRIQMYNLLQRLGADEVFEPAFLSQVDRGTVARQQQQVWDAAVTPSLVNRMLAFDWRYTLAETDLPKVCGTAQLAGVAVGFPMLDARLLDFSLALPAPHKLRGLKLRWFFKEALRGFLPDEILVKKKQGFGLPFGVWATQHAGLNRLAADSLGSLAGRGVVRPGFIKTLLGTHLAAHPGYYGEMVWILMMLEQWLQRHRPDFKLQA
ncbi:MAG: asparagine synthase [Leptothrix sp. (in: Bacteria)]|nr:asparagine synthase [Leptothrix sp. (in: b-proteobacteria)]